AFAVRGFVGGVVSTLGGGKFGHGFVSAGVGGGFSKDTGLVTRMLVSGAISDATGGKFISGAATAAFAWAMQNLNLEPSGTKIQPNSTAENEAAIEKLESLPEDPKSVYAQGRKLAEAQNNLNVNETVKYDPRHAFCPRSTTCTTGNVVYRPNVREAIDFLKNNSGYVLLLGANVDGWSYIYPSATVSNNVYYPIGTKGYRLNAIGRGPDGFIVTGPESVLSVIAHETGHREGVEHGALMNKREYDAIMRSREK
ncbi:hypothetical protein, partial [Microbulbifer taiwanensis]